MSDLTTDPIHLFMYVTLTVVLGLLVAVGSNLYLQRLESLDANRIAICDRSHVSEDIYCFNLASNPIHIKLSWLRRGVLRLSLLNMSKNVIDNGVLNIILPAEVKPIRGAGWETALSNVYIRINKAYNNYSNLLLPPLELEFLRVGRYEFEYRLNGDKIAITHRFSVVTH